MTPMPAVHRRPDLPAAVAVHEVGLRDGLQNEPVSLPTAVKAEAAHRLVGAGLRSIELTSFVRPDRVPQLADAEALLEQVALGASVAGWVLVPNRQGLERALAAGARHIAVFASVTESFSERNLGCSTAEALRRFGPIVHDALEAGAAVRGYLSMCFGDPWEGPVPVEATREAACRLAELGCGELSLGDTIGVATPGHVTAVIDALGAAGLGAERLALHPHDTYGQALANVLAALEAGVATVDASAGGLGGCPFARAATGNLATEDLLWMLEGLGIETGVDLAAVAETSRWLAGHLGRPSPSRVVAALTSAVDEGRGQ
jgi:hydroxymethylglutaryl-CoA lyase